MPGTTAQGEHKAIPARAKRGTRKDNARTRENVKHRERQHAARLARRRAGPFARSAARARESASGWPARGERAPDIASPSTPCSLRPPAAERVWIRAPQPKPPRPAEAPKSPSTMRTRN